MPRQARIDASGALQHIITRGIERRAIFKNDTDRDDFINRLGYLLKERRYLLNTMSRPWKICLSEEPGTLPHLSVSMLLSSETI
jgi:hypothetical protein